jgi:hypothetical protein
MAVTVNTTMVDTEARLSDELVVDMSPDISMKEGSDTEQFMTILNRLPSRSAHNPKINWLEDQFLPAYATLAASATSAATVITLTSGEGNYFRVNDIILHGASGEKMKVSGISANSAAITRSIGSVAAAALASGDDLVNLGGAFAQGADIGQLRSTDRVLGYNYTQIVRNAGGFTNTDVETKTYGADDPAREIAKKAIEHKKALENLHWTGGRAFTSNAPSSIGFMGGITEFVTTNVTTGFGSLAASGLTGFDPLLQTAFQYGSMNKALFVAPGAAAGLSYLLANNWVRAQPNERVYGAKVSAWINGAFGESLPVFVKREWGIYGSSGRELGGAVFCLDLDYIRKRPLVNRDTKLLMNRQGNGEDRVLFEYLTETSLEVKNEAAHAIIYGVVK